VLGEPLLYPDILAAVRYASGKGLQVTITTNGSLLTAEMIKGLNDSGLYSMDISLQLLGGDRHASRHAGMPFEEYYRGVVDSVRTIHETAGFRLIVKVMNTKYRKLFSFDRLPGFTQEGREFRALVCRLMVDIYRALGRDVGEAEVIDKAGKANLDSAVRIRLEDKLFVFVQLFMDWGNAFSGGRVYTTPFGACSFAFTAPAVLSDGSVVMCCGDYDGNTKLGHIDESSISGILRSDCAKYLWEGFEKRRLRHSYCRRCLGSPNPFLAWGKGLGSIFVSRFMNLEGENQVIIR